jgi:hypothetical protein
MSKMYVKVCEKGMTQIPPPIITKAPHFFSFRIRISKINSTALRAKHNLLQFLVMHECTVIFYNKFLEYNLLSQFSSAQHQK